MNNGRQANGDRWVGYSNCDKHICTEGGECNVCEIERLTAENEQLTDEIERLQCALWAYLRPGEEIPKSLSDAKLQEKDDD